MSHHHAGIGVVILGAVILIGVVINGRGDDSRANLTSDAAMAKTFEGCITVEMSEREIQLIKDIPAWSAYMEPRVKLGECREIAAGTRVAVEKRLAMADTKIRRDVSVGNWYCVRPYGDPTCFWMLGGFVFGKPL